MKAGWVGNGETVRFRKRFIGAEECGMGTDIMGKIPIYISEQLVGV